MQRKSMVIHHIVRFGSGLFLIFTENLTERDIMESCMVEQARTM
jgi:hypothetical protein